jgi:hypothetical protein
MQFFISISGFFHGSSVINNNTYLTLMVQCCTARCKHCSVFVAAPYFFFYHIIPFLGAN